MSLLNLKASAKNILDKNEAINDFLGSIPSDIFLFQDDDSSKVSSTIYDPVVCLILQGSKEVVFGENEKKRVNAGQSIIVSHSTPLSSFIVESNAQNPYQAIIFTINIKELQSFYHEINYDATNEASIQSIKVGHTDDSLADTFRRYLELSNKPQEAEVLAPLIRKEIYYRLLMTEHGCTLRQMLSSDSHAFRIMKATIHIKENYNKTLAMPDLANISGMSLASFYNHFKSIMGLSPLQYQKELRLIQAQQLLKYNELSVTSVAFEVGYESPTQFSREFARKFEKTPKSVQQTP